MLMLVYMIYEYHVDVLVKAQSFSDMHLALGTCTSILILETTCRLNTVRVNFSKIPVMVRFL